MLSLLSGGRDVDVSPPNVFISSPKSPPSLNPEFTAMITPNHIECPDADILLHGTSSQAIVSGLPFLFRGVAISDRHRRTIVPGRYKRSLPNLNARILAPH